MHMLRIAVLAGGMTLISMVGLRSVGLPWYAWIIQFVILVGAGLVWGKFLAEESGESRGSEDTGRSSGSRGAAGRQRRRALALLIGAVAAVILILVYLFLIVWV